MDTTQIKGHFARIGEIMCKTDETEADGKEFNKLTFNLAEEFFLNQARIVELLDSIESELIEINKNTTK